MMWRRVICVLGAGLLCTGLLLADDQNPRKPAPPPANPAGLLSPSAVGEFLSDATTTATAPPRPPAGGERQGGDTCATAFVINSLPFSDTGTTCGYTNDYDEVCPYEGSTSPDVVYSYSPTANGAIDISLCNNGTSYDTKLYVYDGTCPGPLVACNDDACTTPQYPNPYVSQLQGVGVTAGHTYYIVVDGYGGDCGNYAITVAAGTPPPDCPPGSLFSQRPHLPPDNWSFATSDAGSLYTVYEKYTVQGSIGDIHFWGLDLQYNLGWYECTEDPMTFEVNFYQDAGGLPGPVVCSYTIIPTRTPTGLMYAGYEQNYYSAILSPVCNLMSGWVSIKGVSVGSPTDCWFLWASSPVGDVQSLQWDGSVYNQTGYDRAVCLTGEYVPIFGACCDDSTGICIDNVEIINCIGPNKRFVANTLCVNIQPPCGMVAGACCFETGDCQILTQGECATALGNWLGPNTTCAQCPCITPCPPGGVPEQEPCGSDTNGGCNMPTPTFEPIACGETKCGTGWFDGSLRDTDWYEISFATDTQVTFTVEAEFEVLFGLIEQTVLGVPGCGNITGYVNPYQIMPMCSVASVTTACLPPGTYYFFVAPTFNALVNCPARYVAKLECVPCTIPKGACCLQSGECIPDQTEGQCTAAGGQWQGNGSVCTPNPCTPFYCAAGATTCDEYISRVQVGTIDNPTGCGLVNGYSNYTAMSTSMNIGTGYPITVTNGNLNWPDDQCGIWVDWNHDYDFYDAGEAMSVAGSPGIGPYTATITPPAGAAAGNTRLRIRITWTGAVDPCGTTSYGEVEDYTINVVGGAQQDGDMNCDGVVNAFDIDPFVLALTNPAAYQAQYPNCNIMNADINDDGVINAFDIDPFVVCLTTGNC